MCVYSCAFPAVKYVYVEAHAPPPSMDVDLLDFMIFLRPFREKRFLSRCFFFFHYTACARN